MKILCLTPVQHISGLIEKLRSFGELLYLPDPSKQEAIDCIRNAMPDVLFVNPNKMKYRLDCDVLCDCVGVVCTASTGTDHIDLGFCESSGITVISITRDYQMLSRVTATAELAFGLMLSLLRKLPSALGSAKRGVWDCEEFIGRQLSSLVVGVVGYGRLGAMFARYCSAFGSKVMYFDPYVQDSSCQYIKVHSLERLFEYCDVVSLHVHLGDETRGMVDAKLFDSMDKSGVFLVNTSRGGVVNEHDVVCALESGVLGGYAADVVCGEYDSPCNSELVVRSNDLNIFVTPHIGGVTKESQEIAYHYVADKLGNKVL